MNINKGYLRVTTVSPVIEPGNIRMNLKTIKKIIQGHQGQTDILVFPELALTGYTCSDMFLSPDFKNSVDSAIRDLRDSIRDIIVILGAPFYTNHGRILNSAFVLGLPDVYAVPKKNLPNYSEFYEKRWFNLPMTDPSDSNFLVVEYGSDEDFRTLPDGIFKINGVNIGIEICEDLWAPNPPSTKMVTEGSSEIIINLSASPDLVGKREYIRDLVRMTSARLACAYIYCSAGPSESTTDLVFSGYGVASENGVLLGETGPVVFGDQVMTMVYDLDLDTIRGWRRKNKTIEVKETAFIPMDAMANIEGYNGKVSRIYSKHPFMPKDSETFRHILNVMSLGIQKRLESVGKMPVVIGLSGGSDSTLALIATVNAVESLDMPRTNIHAISMPCFGTSDRTKSNASKLAAAYGVTFKEIPIGQVVIEHLKSLDHDLNNTDIAYENAQARTRTMTLFDYSNMIGGLVIGTGDLSELALGWCTYGADHLSSYNPNVSIPKTLVIPIIKWVSEVTQVQSLSEVLSDIADTPISPELLPGQQLSEDTVGPYELMDFFLYYFLRAEWPITKILGIAIDTYSDKYSGDFIKDRLIVFLRRFASQQFKRSCLPDGPKIGAASLSPRGDWRMPSDMSFNELISDVINYDTKKSYL